MGRTQLTTRSHLDRDVVEHVQEQWRPRTKRDEIERLEK